jgi:imidazolonepropionase-like amidohydrolase
VREIAASGADLIKICASPGVASPSDHMDHRDFSPEEVEAICEEAAARGLSVAAHAHSQNGIELAIRSGVHDIQHASFLKERHVDLAHERNCTVTPTSWVVAELQRAEGLSDFVKEKGKLVAESHAKAVQYAASGELAILMGTDPVLPGMHGRNYMELVHLVADGLSPLLAWFGATGLAARHIGAQDTGTIEPGQRADLLLATEDVVERPERFERGALAEVLQDGVGHRGLPGVPQRDFGTTVRTVLENP